LCYQALKKIFAFIRARVYQPHKKAKHLLFLCSEYFSNQSYHHEQMKSVFSNLISDNRRQN